MGYVFVVEIRQAVGFEHSVNAGRFGEQPASLL